MENCSANHCIQCSVMDCKNHCSDENYCKLDCVCIGTHEANPTQCQCTDCKSYIKA
ncbi:MAG: DUF1540 domain-containing protein [Oscillospiraceae bacterium]